MPAVVAQAAFQPFLLACNHDMGCWSSVKARQGIPEGPFQTANLSPHDHDFKLVYPLFAPMLLLHGKAIALPLATTSGVHMRNSS